MGVSGTPAFFINGRRHEGPGKWTICWRRWNGPLADGRGRCAHRSGCSASRSIPSCTRCSTSSLSLPWLRSSTTALRSASRSSRSRRYASPALRSGGTRDLGVCPRSGVPDAPGRAARTRSISCGSMIDRAVDLVPGAPARPRWRGSAPRAPRAGRRRRPSARARGSATAGKPLQQQGHQDHRERSTTTTMSRWGNGAPSGNVSGRASASASETMPRIPVQPISTHGLPGRRGSRSRSAGPAGAAGRSPIGT